MQKMNCCQDVLRRTAGALFLLLFICNCQKAFSQGILIGNSIPVPHGCQRITYSNGSFSHWIQNLGLKDPPVIRNHRGAVVRPDFYSVWGVVRMPLLFQSNLEQCADFAMRFWAEYHKTTGKLDRLYLFDYDGKRNLFKLSGRSYVQFLKTAFANTNSHSLKQGCKSVDAADLMPGDLFVQNERGGVGHVSVVLDVCQTKDGNRLYLIGYSFMPAQEFHIEKARESYGIEGWFTLDGYLRYLKDFLDFGTPVLRRFDPS
jgi:hypothetical protein